MGSIRQLVSRSRPTGLRTAILTLLLAAGAIMAAAPAAAQSPPDSPGSVTVTRAGDTLTAAWDAPAGATKYHVTYSFDSGQSWTAAAGPDDGHAAATIDIPDIDTAKVYIVGVRAGNDHGWSSWRNSQPNAPLAATPTPAPVAEAQSVGLAATVNSDRSVDLALSNGPSNWWFRINDWGTCTAASGSTVSNIRGYQAGTHAVTAYSDSNCGSQIATSSFTIPTATLAATVNSDRSVDLTLTGGPTNWWFRIGSFGTCTAATGTTFSNIRGYAAGTYYVGAGSDSACTDHVATTTFTIPAATLATTVNNDGSVDLTLTGGPGNWWFRIEHWGTCTAATGPTVSNIRGYAAGTYSVAAYSDSGCNFHIASSSFTIAVATLAATVDPADWSVDLALANGPQNWWFRIEHWGTCTAASGTSYDNIRGYQAGTYVVAVFPDNNCGSHGAIAGTTFTIPDATLTATVKSGGAFDLTLANGPTNWWFRIDLIGTCTPAAGTTVSNIGGYQAGQHVVWAYTGGGCTYPVASLTFDLITLTASGIDATGATLTLAGHSGDWYYKRTGGPANAACTTVNSSATATLSNLTADTAYAYTAYKNSGCGSGELASVSFATHLTAQQPVRDRLPVHLQLQPAQPLRRRLQHRRQGRRLRAAQRYRQVQGQDRSERRAGRHRRHPARFRVPQQTGLQAPGRRDAGHPERQQPGHGGRLHLHLRRGGLRPVRRHDVLREGRRHRRRRRE